MSKITTLIVLSSLLIFQLVINFLFSDNYLFFGWAFLPVAIGAGLGALGSFFGRDNTDEKNSELKKLIDKYLPAVNVHEETKSIKTNTQNILNDKRKNNLALAKSRGVDPQSLNNYNYDKNILLSEINNIDNVKRRNEQRNLQRLNALSGIKPGSNLFTDVLSGTLQGAGLGSMFLNANVGTTVPGPDVNKDIIPILATPGEKIINKEASNMYGNLLEEINKRGLVKRTLDGNSAENPELPINQSENSENPDSVSNTLQNVSRETIPPSNLMDSVSFEQIKPLQETNPEIYNLLLNLIKKGAILLTK